MSINPLGFIGNCVNDRNPIVASCFVVFAKTGRFCFLGGALIHCVEIHVCWNYRLSVYDGKFLETVDENLKKMSQIPCG
jgi:hypothetical protein